MKPDDIVIQSQQHGTYHDNTGTDAEYIEHLELKLDKDADEIERLRAAGDSMAKLLTRLPCSCVEGSNGEINETCEICEHFFHWQEASRG
jgi:hypothetical protein